MRNLSTSPICAMTGEPIGVIGRHEELLVVAQGLMSEGLATAKAHGITLDVDFERAYGPRPKSPHKSSMLQDLERGRPPEIDGMLTAVQAFRPRRRRADAACRHGDRAGHGKGAADGPLSAGGIEGKPVMRFLIGLGALANILLVSFLVAVPGSCSVARGMSRWAIPVCGLGFLQWLSAWRRWSPGWCCKAATGAASGP